LLIDCPRRVPHHQLSQILLKQVFGADKADEEKLFGVGGVGEGLGEELVAQGCFGFLFELLVGDS